MPAYTRAFACLCLFSTCSLLAQQPDLTPTTIRATLADEQRLIAAHPRDPNNFINRAYTLTDAGAGEPAWAAARQAMIAAPQSALAHSAAGWVLHHNLIGIDYGKGYDYEGSLAAYRKAMELAPDDLDVRQSLADSLEYNPDGIRYAPDSHLSEAIAILRYVKARMAVVPTHVEDNLLIDLFYAGRYTEVAPEIIGPPTPVRDGVALAAVAASQGSAAAINLANQWAGDPARRTAALNFAAEGLWNRQLYPQAADLLEAGLQEGGDQSNTLRKVQLFRSLKPFDGKLLPADDPRRPVQELFIAAFSGNLSLAVANANITRIGLANNDDWLTFVDQLRTVGHSLQALSAKTGLPLAVMRDIALGSLRFTVEPGEQPGARIAVQFISSPPRHYFVLKEDGAWKLVTADNGAAAAGNAALFLFHHDRHAEAHALLDWQRDRVQSGGGDDPLGGNLFARFWTSGANAGSDAIETAAAALVAEDATNPALLANLTATLEKTRLSDQTEINRKLLLASSICTPATARTRSTFPSNSSLATPIPSLQSALPARLKACSNSGPPGLLCSTTV